MSQTILNLSTRSVHTRTSSRELENRLVEYVNAEPPAYHNAVDYHQEVRRGVEIQRILLETDYANLCSIRIARLILAHPQYATPSTLSAATLRLATLELMVA